jgi:hypothetical protein
MSTQDARAAKGWVRRATSTKRSAVCHGSSGFGRPYLLSPYRPAKARNALQRADCVPSQKRRRSSIKQVSAGGYRLRREKADLALGRETLDVDHVREHHGERALAAIEQ